MKFLIRPAIVALPILLIACVSDTAREPSPVPKSPEPTDELPAEERPEIEITGSWLDEGVVDSNALARWLRARQYRVWEGATGVTPSPQGGTRVFVNEVLADSLTAGEAQHPLGAIGVRELYQNDLATPKAINLTIKMADDEGDGSGWLFFELGDLEPGRPPTVDEPAAPRCVACHAAPEAHDFVMTPWPLR